MDAEDMGSIGISSSYYTYKDHIRVLFWHFFSSFCAFRFIVFPTNVSFADFAKCNILLLFFD